MPKAERALIAAIRRLSGRKHNPAVIRAIGDDGAVLKISPRHQLLVTTDLCVENVHFRRAWHPPASVGHRCLTRGLSDIAAMGGKPLACFLSLGLPTELPQPWVDSFLTALTRLASRFGVELAGGDVSQAPEIVADIIVAGQVPAGAALLRSTARPGDLIYVSGQLGSSGAVLQRMHSGRRVRPSNSNRSHFFPEPRLEVGQWLRGRGLATAMIDISDGLSVDLAHICEESRVSAEIIAESVPVAKGADLKLALHSGDDYELLFTARPRTRIPAQIAGVPVTHIGIIGPARGRLSLTICDRHGRIRRLLPQGWQHFAKNEKKR